MHHGPTKHMDCNFSPAVGIKGLLRNLLLKKTWKWVKTESVMTLGNHSARF